MPERLDQCVKSVMEQGKSEESARAICTAQFKDTYRGAFRDAAVFNAAEKTAISVRDGVIEYLGIELGMEPIDQLFTVYRSPATIANAAMKMRGIPLTDEHVSLDVPPPGNGGFVADADMVDAHDPNKQATIAIRNKLAIGDTLAATVAAGKSELSLGYHADLIPHDNYDFEQLRIQPHHLAVVKSGRCGSMCSFIDRKPTTEDPAMPKLHKAFTDAEGAMNLQQIVELATALPEAIKSVPVDQLTKLLPALKQIVEAAKAVMPAEDPAPAEPAPAVDEDPEPKPAPAADEDPAPDDKDKPKPFGDAEMKTAIRTHAAVIEKARQFLPETYSFADKDTADIMRDTIAAIEPGGKFADNELSLVFKLLKKPVASYAQFGDQGASTFSNLKDKEL